MIIVIKKWKEDNEYFEVQYDTDTNIIVALQMFRENIKG